MTKCTSLKWILIFQILIQSSSIYNHHNKWNRLLWKIKELEECCCQKTESNGMDHEGYCKKHIHVRQLDLGQYMHVLSFKFTDNSIRRWTLCVVLKTFRSKKRYMVIQLIKVDIYIQSSYWEGGDWWAKTNTTRAFLN